MISEITTNPIHDTLEISKAISEYGILIILAALMILSFISMAIILFRMMRSTNLKIIESQQQIIIQNSTIQSLLTKITEAETIESLLQQTKWNAEKILKVSFDTNLIALLKGTSEILSHNHIEDKEFTNKRIQSLVRSAHFDQIKWLNNYRYQGTKLGEYADNETWIEKKIEILQSYIYSTTHNRDTLVRDLSLAYTEFINQIEI